MRRVANVWLIFFAFSSFGAAPPDRSVTFIGEATEGQTFRKDIGHGLDFVLMPDAGGRRITGWTIEVSPQGKPSDPQCEDFLWVVTPPYHFQNARYLDTSYGIPAQDAVRNSLRVFNFVLNCSDFGTERKRVELAIYPNGASEQEVDEARAKLGSSPLGKGQLWIIDSKITPGHKSGTAEDLGAIHWIKFKVEIEFPEAPPLPPKPRQPAK
ncbi:MAG: hypothetical protein WAO35_26890 [Terriglobia bacterium]